MSNCTITDRLYYYDPDGTPVPLTGLQVFAVPDLVSRRIEVTGGVYRALQEHPDITSSPYRRGRIATSDGNGEFSFALPYPASTHPLAPSPKWSLVLPSGDIYTGTVPAVAGPLTLDDLVTSHSWTLASEVYLAPNAPGALARGTAALTAQTSASIVFATAFATATYIIKLTPSTNSITDAPPLSPPAYANKSTTGFDIVMGETFTGTVDWTADAT